jgi:hypothetical protein
LGLVFTSALAGACSSASNPTTDDSGASDGGPMEMEAAICPAASLTAPADAAVADCFTCVAAMCMSELTTCSTDCMCAPAWQCVEQMSVMGSINTGYSQCQAAISALSNGDVAMMNLQTCSTMKCNPQCFGDGGAAGH